jgi:hypothetical protein
MASKTQPTQTRQGVPLQKDDRADALREFAQCASALRDLLYDDRALDEEEFLFMDNHFQVLQMAYLRWKRRHRPTDELRA